MQTKERFLAFDGLRGIAALMVVFEHYGADIHMITDERVRLGALGVMLFFCLSGFLMVHVTHNKPITVANLKAFYLSRFSRVIPLFIVVLIVAYFYQKAMSPFGFSSSDLVYIT